MSTPGFGEVPHDNAYTNLAVRRNIVAQTIAVEDLTTDVVVKSIVTDSIMTDSIVTEAFQLPVGTSLASKVLTSDVNGNGSWQALPPTALSEDVTSVTVNNPAISGVISISRASVVKYGNLVVFNVVVSGTNMRWDDGQTFTLAVPQGYRPAADVPLNALTGGVATQVMGLKVTPLGITVSDYSLGNQSTSATSVIVNGAWFASQ